MMLWTAYKKNTPARRARNEAWVGGPVFHRVGSMETTSVPVRASGIVPLPDYVRSGGKQ